VWEDVMKDSEGANPPLVSAMAGFSKKEDRFFSSQDFFRNLFIIEG
jgi:hypothetical protein